MLKKLLEELGQGEHIPLEHRSNQYGDTIVTSALSFEGGLWFLEELNCQSSKDLALGICNCVLHNIFRIKQVTRAEAMEELRQVVTRQENDETRRQAEITWLNDAITVFHLFDSTPASE